MKRWMLFAIAVSMLTPFALWGGFALAGLGGGLANLSTAREGLVLTLAAVPVAGLFWLQSLRQIGDSMGAPSRWSAAERLTRLMPFAVLGLGGVGAAWIWTAEGPGTPMALAAGGTLAMAGAAAIGARLPAVPQGRAHDHPTLPTAAGDRSGEAFLWFVLNCALATGTLMVLWDPLLPLWIAVGLVPVVFAVLIRLAAWGGRTA